MAFWDDIGGALDTVGSVLGQVAPTADKAKEDDPYSGGTPGNAPPGGGNNSSSGWGYDSWGSVIAGAVGTVNSAGVTISQVIDILGGGSKKPEGGKTPPYQPSPVPQPQPSSAVPAWAWIAGGGVALLVMLKMGRK